MNDQPVVPYVARVGLDYLGDDGKFHRAEAGELLAEADVDPKAWRWMTDAGFLVPDKGISPDEVED